VDGEYYGGRSVGDLFYNEADADAVVSLYPKGSPVNIQ
jgi:hypothetical protein